MSTKTVSARLEGDGLRLVAMTGSGHQLVIDNGEGDTGPRPAELLVAALAGWLVAAQQVGRATIVVPWLCASIRHGVLP